MMLAQDIRVEEKIVSYQLEDGHIWDIDKLRLSEDIKVDDELDFNVEIAKK